ncbi:unnamed protein product [Cuscuta epithymum]|uniref:RRM domain-containing protein n=1 Tax=Cuscuta epithymum TaxID=186058 RepID=A0AAV0CLC0_9ASTE|nr:unnamed protein product [Cuscuta epithymum]
MLISSPLVATTATTTAASAYASSSSLSSALPLYTHLPSHNHRFSLATAFRVLFKSKPIELPKLNTHFSVLRGVTRSPTFCASADAITAIQEDSHLVEPDQEEEGEDEGAESQPDDAGKLFVGNLPFTVTSSQLSEIFSEAGHVRNVEVIYDRVTLRSRGFAFVTMGSVEEANEAIRMFNLSQIGGRSVKVNFPEVPKGGEREVIAPRVRSSNAETTDSQFKIYAANLNWRLTSQGLKEAFADQPGMLNANVVYDLDSGRSQGYGFISFASAEELEAALKTMDGVEVEGRPLRLQVAKGKSF